jgi:signal-transduction protein with cAMP-binding, CBS, and nucleotidyltransferase domain
MSQKPYIPARAVMSPTIMTIDGLASITDAVKLMKANHISSLVVEKRHDHDEYGLVTVKDIAEKVIVPDLSPDRVSAYEVMRKPVLSVDAAMDIRYAVRLLSRFGMSRALVLEDGKAVGLVTLRDMVLGQMDAAGDGAAET